MTDEEKYQQAVYTMAELVDKIISEAIFEHGQGSMVYARQILSLSGDWGRVAVVEKQNLLPKRGIRVCGNCWIQTQNDMLDAGFVQEIKPDEGKG